MRAIRQPCGSCQRRPKPNSLPHAHHFGCFAKSRPNAPFSQRRPRSIAGSRRNPTAPAPRYTSVLSREQIPASLSNSRMSLGLSGDIGLASSFQFCRRMDWPHRRPFAATYTPPPRWPSPHGAGCPTRLPAPLCPVPAAQKSSEHRQTVFRHITVLFSILPPTAKFSNERTPVPPFARHKSVRRADQLRKAALPKVFSPALFTSIPAIGAWRPWKNLRSPLRSSAASFLSRRGRLFHPCARRNRPFANGEFRVFGQTRPRMRASFVIPIAFRAGKKTPETGGGQNTVTTNSFASYAILEPYCGCLCPRAALGRLSPPLNSSKHGHRTVR